MFAFAEQSRWEPTAEMKTTADDLHFRGPIALGVPPMQMAIEWKITTRTNARGTRSRGSCVCARFFGSHVDAAYETSGIRKPFFAEKKGWIPFGDLDAWF